jgi:hypothetical protein
MKCIRYGKRSIIARHRGHAFFSASQLDYASNEANAVSELSQFVALIEKRRTKEREAGRWPNA